MHRPLVCLALAATLSGCGETTSEPPTRPAPYRESIDPEREAEVAKRKLPARDEPLAVGAIAPALEALPAGTPAIVVFYRGHW